jgi:hypothetical protein
MTINDKEGKKWRKRENGRIKKDRIEGPKIKDRRMKREEGMMKKDGRMKRR